MRGLKPDAFERVVITHAIQRYTWEMKSSCETVKIARLHVFYITFAFINTRVGLGLGLL